MTKFYVGKWRVDKPNDLSLPTFMLNLGDIFQFIRYFLEENKIQPQTLITCCKDIKKREVST